MEINKGEREGKKKKLRRCRGEEKDGEGGGFEGWEAIRPSITEEWRRIVGSLARSIYQTIGM